MQNTIVEMNAIPKEAFEKYFQQWEDHWTKYVEMQGAYNERD